MSNAPKNGRNVGQGKGKPGGMVERKELEARLKALTQRNAELGAEIEAAGGGMLPVDISPVFTIQVKAAFEVLFKPDSIETLRWQVRFQELFYEEVMKDGMKNLEEAKQAMAAQQLGMGNGGKLILPNLRQVPPPGEN